MVDAVAYSTDAVERLLAELRELAPKLCAVRMQSGRHGTLGPSPVDMNLERHPAQSGGMLRLDPASIVYGRTRVMDLLKVDVERAERIAEALLHLARLNSFGAWAVRPEPESDPVDLSLDALSSVAPDGRAYVDAVLRDLRRLLPTVATIHADRYLERSASGHTRNKVFLRFWDQHQDELAAVDGAMMNLQLRHASLPVRDKHALVNSARNATWCRQLQVSPAQLPQVLHALALLFVTLPVRRIDLDAGELHEREARRA